MESNMVLLHKSLKKLFEHQPNICLEDLSASMENVKSRVYSDSGHLNAMGNKIMAKSILAQILECGLLKASERN